MANRLFLKNVDKSKPLIEKVVHTPPVVEDHIISCTDPTTCTDMNTYRDETNGNIAGTNTDGVSRAYWAMWQHIMDVQWVAYLWVYGCIFAVMAGG